MDKQDKTIALLHLIHIENQAILKTIGQTQCNNEGKETIKCTIQIFETEFNKIIDNNYEFTQEQLNEHNVCKKRIH